MTENVIAKTALIVDISINIEKIILYISFEVKAMRIYKHFKKQNEITLYNGDCSNLLKEIPDETVDLIITSPPYCIGKEYENPHDDIESFKKQHSQQGHPLFQLFQLREGLSRHLPDTALYPCRCGANGGRNGIAAAGVISCK